MRYNLKIILFWRVIITHTNIIEKSIGCWCDSCLYIVLHIMSEVRQNLTLCLHNRDYLTTLYIIFFWKWHATDIIADCVGKKTRCGWIQIRELISHLACSGFVRLRRFNTNLTHIKKNTFQTWKTIIRCIQQNALGKRLGGKRFSIIFSFKKKASVLFTGQLLSVKSW